MLCETNDMKENFFLKHYIEQKITYFHSFSSYTFFLKLSHKPLSKISTFNFYLTILCIAQVNDLLLLLLLLLLLPFPI